IPEPEVTLLERREPCGREDHVDILRDALVTIGVERHRPPDGIRNPVLVERPREREQRPLDVGVSHEEPPGVLERRLPHQSSLAPHSYVRPMRGRVPRGQPPFAMPGVATDARGIVPGKNGVILFPSVDGVVRWLRLYSDEDSLDDLLPGMKILRALTPLRSR